MEHYRRGTYAFEIPVDHDGLHVVEIDHAGCDLSQLQNVISHECVLLLPHSPTPIGQPGRLLVEYTA